MTKFKIFTMVMVAEMSKERFPVGKGHPSEVDLKEMMDEATRRWATLNHAEMHRFNLVFETLTSMDTSPIDNAFKKEITGR